VLPEREAFPLARAAAHRALELEPSLYEARTTLAFLSFYFDWDWAATEAQLATLLEERPDDSVARQWHAEYLAAMGRFEAALAELKRGQRSDPLSPILRSMEGYVHFVDHQFRAAIEACRRSAAVDPTFRNTPYLLAMAQEGLGAYEPALEFWRRIEPEQDATTSGLDTARLLARLGRRAEARERFRRVVEASRSGPALAPAIVATVHVALGEHAEAMDCLEQAFEERSYRLLRVRHDFRYDPLHSDPRFAQLVRRMNFPPP
jgi:tetratricopeptide (TPR) repeat protein